jgi:hypothetical protein
MGQQERGRKHGSQGGAGCRAQRRWGIAQHRKLRAPAGPSPETRRAPHADTGRQTNTRMQASKPGQSTPPGSQPRPSADCSRALRMRRRRAARRHDATPRRRLAAARRSSTPRLQPSSSRAAVDQPAAGRRARGSAPRVTQAAGGSAAACRGSAPSRRGLQVEASTFPGAAAPCTAAPGPQPRGRGPSNGGPARAGEGVAGLLPRRIQVAGAPGVS